MADRNQRASRSSATHSKLIGILHKTTPIAFAWTGHQRVRFSDFQVNEISLDGTVVHLRNTRWSNEPVTTLEPSSEPSKPDNGTTHKIENASLPEKSEAKEEVPAEDLAILKDLTNEAFVQNVVKMYKGEPSMDGTEITSATSEPLTDRYKRGQIHNEIRRIFKSSIETSTGDSGAITAVKIARKGGNKRSRGFRASKSDGPIGEYLHFTLYKDNRDTMDAVSQIARILRLKPQLIAYAGTKDRRASTAQRCSVRRVKSKALAGTNSKLWGIVTGDYKYQDEPIRLGQLLGNEFVITLKDCQILGSSSQKAVTERLDMFTTHVTATLQHLHSHGWINYFGHQRFGTCQIGTHEVGKLILGGKWEEAVMSLLAYDADIAAKADEGEVPTEALKREEYARHHACMLFQSGCDPKRAAKIMPGRFTAETCILRHLTKGGQGSLKDFAGSLTHITRGLRSMYLHAYQSYVWNHAASRRWELHGDQVVEGDLVIDDGQGPPVRDADQDSDGDDVVHPANVQEDDETAVRARPLTAEEASSGRYTIYDLVLPSPGFDVLYPSNEIGIFYTEFMARPENGALDPRNMRRLRREFSLPGRYRKLMTRFLSAPSIDFRLYIDDTEQMHPTDLDLLHAATKKRALDDDHNDSQKRVKIDASEGSEATLDPVREGASQDTPAGAKPEDAAPAPQKIAAVVKFQLGSSAYATVALRELMGE